jgi:hypothetical protein
MKRITVRGWVAVASVAAVAVFGGCSSSSYSDAGTGGSGGSGSSCGGATPVELTVMNFESWCSVSIAGGTASTDATVTQCVAAGIVDLSATAASSTFEVGKAPWMGTATDTVSGGTASATVDAKAPSTCVAVCCPFVTGGTPCPTTNPCP